MFILKLMLSRIKNILIELINILAYFVDTLSLICSSGLKEFKNSILEAYARFAILTFFSFKHFLLFFVSLYKTIYLKFLDAL